MSAAEVANPTIGQLTSCILCTAPPGEQHVPRIVALPRVIRFHIGPSSDRNTRPKPLAYRAWLSHRSRCQQSSLFFQDSSEPKFEGLEFSPVALSRRQEDRRYQGPFAHSSPTLLQTCDRALRTIIRRFSKRELGVRYILTHVLTESTIGGFSGGALQAVRVKYWKVVVEQKDGVAR